MKLSRNGRLLKNRAGLYNICVEILHPKEDYDMSKVWKKVLAASMAGTLVLGLSACGSSGKGEGGSGDGHLVFMIWDSGQKSGMEDIAEA